MGHRCLAKPIAERIVWTVSTCKPSTWVRSTPANRERSLRQAKVGSFPLGLVRFCVRAGKGDSVRSTWGVKAAYFCAISWAQAVSC